MALVGAGVLIGAGTASTGISGYEAATGREAFTGQELSDEERSETVGSLAGGLVGAAAGGEAGGALFDRPITPGARGRISEGRVLAKEGLVKNNELVNTHEGTSIPDYITEEKLGDIKDVKALSDTKQMRIQRGAAQQRGLIHEVQTGRRTNVTGPMLRSGTRIIRRPDLGPGARTSSGGIPALPILPQPDRHD